MGSEALGISHDPVNLVCRIEDSVAPTKRVAPYIRQVHLDGATITFDGDRMRRYVAALGAGDINWPAILGVVGDVPLWLEFHRGQFAMPVFDKAWIAAQPDLTLMYRALLATAFARFRNPEQSRWNQAGPFGRLGAGAQAWLSRRNAG